MVIQVLENVKPIIEVALDNEIKIHVQKALNQKKNITTNVLYYLLIIYNYI